MLEFEDKFPENNHGASERPQSLVIGGVNFEFPTTLALGTPMEIEIQKLQIVTEKAHESKDVDKDVHSLPATLVVGDQEIDIQTTRTWLAVGIGESRSWVSDLDVLDFIIEYELRK
jgi:hypothetical protein